MQDDTIKAKGTKIELQTARSDLLDAFAGIENELARYETKLHLKANKASFGQKIERIRKERKLDAGEGELELFDQLTKFNELRNELVHRQMNAAALQGTTKALFIARIDESGLPPLARVYTVQLFHSMTRIIHELGKRLAALAAA